MKLQLNGSFSIVFMVFIAGVFLATFAEAAPQTIKSTPAKVVIPTLSGAGIHADESVPSPLSKLEVKIEPPKYYSSEIPVSKLVTYEVNLRETLLAYSVENKCSTNDAFLKLENHLGMSSLETANKQSRVDTIPKPNAFFKRVSDDVYSISATQGFFNALQAELSDFRYGNKQITVEIRFLDVPQSDVSMLQSFMIPDTFEAFGNQQPVVESFASNGTFANQSAAEKNKTSESTESNKPKGTFVRATETRTKAYPTFIGHVDERGVQQLIQLSKSRSAMSITKASTVSMFPEQHVILNDSSLLPFVVSVNKIKDGTTTVHQPVIQLLENGTTIAFQTEVLAGKLKLSGDLAFSKVLGVETFEYPSDHSSVPAGIMIQVPEHRIRKVHWSAEVAANQSILIDSVETFEAEVKAKTRFKAAETRTMRRLVMITPRLIEQKKEAADQGESQN